MQWQKASEYHLSGGRYTISKAYSGGVPSYTLWRGRKDICYGTLEECKKAAEKAK